MNTSLDIEEESEVQPSSFVLTEEQNNAVELISSFVLDSSKPEFKLGGYAGTGKTTIIKTVQERQRSLNKKVAVAAFTGKAVSVLGKKGVWGTTIHSLMYDSEVQKDGHVEFFKKTVLRGNPDIIIIDEASMISSELYRDLLSFKKKFIFVGDPGQLEPIGDNPNLMKQPDYVLSRIHRQAERSPIITLANNVRQGSVITRGVSSDELTVRNKSLTIGDLCAHDQVICAKNVTRTALNSKIRIAKQLKELLTIGEKLIVLRNNIKLDVFNGLILFVKKIHNDYETMWVVDAEDEVGQEFHKLPIWKKPFLEPIKKDSLIPKDKAYCDYAYVVTCHKSQGSEWNSVLVYDEWMPPQVWDMKRWRYTAITRAAKKLTYCI